MTAVGPPAGTPLAPAGTPLARAGTLADNAPSLLPGLLAIAVFLVWESIQAGFPPTAWYPGALFILLLLAVIAISLRVGLRDLSRPALLAVLLLGAYAIWSFLSIAWADVQGDAWDGANRTALYVCAYAAFALLPWRPFSAAFVLGAFALGTAVVGAVFFVRAVAAADPSGFFIDGRFASPAHYPNANCAIFLTGFWPALFLASRREVPAALRGLLLASSGFLLQLALLPESRGSLFAIPLTVALSLVLIPGRLRLLLAAVTVGIATAATLPALLDVYSSRHSPPGVRAALDDAGLATALSFGALLIVGTVLGLVDRRVELSERITRRVGIAVAVLAVVAALAGSVAFVAAYGSPYRRVAHAWNQFKAGEPASFGSSHFVGDLGSGRYDFWRVAMARFKDQPLQGVGADNFAQDYLRDRRTGEEPLYPHSLEIRALEQTGLVGAVLLAGFFAFALAAALRVRLSRGPGCALAGAAISVFGYWFFHGSVDWFWELPALTAPAIAWLGMAAGLGRGEPRRALAPPLRRVAVAAAGAVAIVLALSYTFPWLAARDLERAQAAWRSNSADAFGRLDDARRLDPLSDLPDLTAGAIAFRLHDRARSRSAFTRALERNPGNWYPYLELGILDSLQGRRASSLRRLEHARQLDPLEPAIKIVLQSVRRRRSVSPPGVDAIFLRRVEERSS